MEMTPHISYDICVFIIFFLFQWMVFGLSGLPGVSAMLLVAEATR